MIPEPDCFSIFNSLDNCGVSPTWNGIVRHNAIPDTRNLPQGVVHNHGIDEVGLDAAVCIVGLSNPVLVVPAVADNLNLKLVPDGVLVCVKCAQGGCLRRSRSGLSAAICG